MDGGNVRFQQSLPNLQDAAEGIHTLVALLLTA